MNNLQNVRMLPFLCSSANYNCSLNCKLVHIEDISYKRPHSSLLFQYEGNRSIYWKYFIFPLFL